MPRAPHRWPTFGAGITAQTQDGLSREKLADLADINETYLSGVRRGKRNPAITVLQDIAEALAPDIEDLVSRRR